MFFTQEDFRKIEEYLKLNAKKDTDFLEFTGLLEEDDIITIVHKGQNYKASLLLVASAIADKVIELVTPNFTTMLKLFDSLEIGGLSLKLLFGNEINYGISQRVITQAFNRIWNKLEDITGEVLQGINMTVSPTYFVGTQNAPIHITADTTEANGIFESIAFYVNEELIAEDTNVRHFEHDAIISDTSVIKCIAKIMGIEYIKEQTVTKYNSFWLGAGNTYFDIVNNENCLIPITNEMRGTYNISVEEGQCIIIVIGKGLKEGFLRADLNGIEIPFTEIMLDINYNETLEEDNAEYIAFVSAPWSEGNYNIDING